MDNTNSSVIGMKKKDATKMDIVQLDKSQTYPETAYFIGSENSPRLGQVAEGLGIRLLYYLRGRFDRGFLCEKLMHIPEDTQAPPK